MINSNNKKYVFVSVDLSAKSIDKPFLYAISDEILNEVKIGCKVRFPFGRGNKEREGYVLDILSENEIKRSDIYKKDPYFKKKDAFNVKEIISVSHNKIGVNDILLDMAIYMSDRYMCNLSTCLKTCTPVKRVVRKNIKSKDKILKYQAIDKKIIFNEEQIGVINELKSAYDQNKFSEHLIHGITGSGKTEVYIELIKYVIEKGKKVIVLIPEISLTYQTVIRLKQVFGDRISIIHSRMSDGERYIQYKKCIDGESDILVGPRSAIFSPFTNLGLIVMDEVHDHSYKSEISPRYDTLDLARFRCERQNAMFVTLSATPSVSYYYEAKNQGKINIHKLNNRAIKDLMPPNIYIADMRKEFKNKNLTSFSKKLRDLINEKLEKKEQIMLYMNKRGHSRLLKCLDCGETIVCPHCDVSLVVHNDKKARCHYCGYEEEIRNVCPKCKSAHLITFGMGTEKLEEKVKEEFPKAKILRMDRDNIKGKDDLDNIIKDFREHKADILIGTQMIVKGHDFPDVTLVGIMCADMSLYMPTYKATEDTFDILMQMEGRSGRNKQGDSVIQTYDTDSFAIDSAVEQDYDDFYNKEIKYREMLNYPPFCTMLTCSLKSNDESYLSEIIDILTIKIKSANIDNLVVLGPNKNMPYKIKDIYRINYFIKCKNYDDAYKLRNMINGYINEIDYLGGITPTYDIER